MTSEIAVSDTTGPTFTDSDFEEVVPGRIYKPLAYAVRFTLFSRLLTQFRLLRIRVRRFLICHCSKKVLKFNVTGTAHGFATEDVVYVNSSSVWAKAKANAICCEHWNCHTRISKSCEITVMTLN